MAISGGLTEYIQLIVAHTMSAQLRMLKNQHWVAMCGSQAHWPSSGHMSHTNYTEYGEKYPRSELVLTKYQQSFHSCPEISFGFSSYRNRLTSYKPSELWGGGQ